MQAEQRRQAILNLLKTETGPVSAAALAARFSVSRQIIVGDIALLRAAGEDISATPRGYVMRQSPAGLVRRVACRHDAGEMEAELLERVRSMDSVSRDPRAVDTLPELVELCHDAILREKIPPVFLGILRTIRDIN